jgi:hypothetical protein
LNQLEEPLATLETFRCHGPRERQARRRPSVEARIGGDVGIEASREEAGELARQIESQVRDDLAHVHEVGSGR